MKAIMISIKPEWVAKILNGEKTLEIRKNAPKCDLPIDVYIYCTKDKKMPLVCDIDGNIVLANEHYAYGDEKLNGKVVAKFTLNKVEEIPDEYDDAWNYNLERIDYWKKIYKESCLQEPDFSNYLKGKKGYAWHINDLVVFDKPKELSEFNTTQRIRYANLGFTEIKPLAKAPRLWCYVEIDNG